MIALWQVTLRSSAMGCRHLNILLLLSLSSVHRLPNSSNFRFSAAAAESEDDFFPNLNRRRVAALLII